MSPIAHEGAQFLPETALLCQGDLVCDKNSSQTIFHVLKTWHEIGVDDPQLDDAVLSCHSSAQPQVLNRYLRDSELARHHIIIAATPVSNLIAHESDFVLLDRPIPYGSVVKRSPREVQSGTVVGTESICDIAHSFLVVENDQKQPEPARLIKDIHAGDLQFAREWEVGDYVIWKNCWLGEVVEVVEAVTICLSNNSVVTIDTPGQLRLRGPLGSIANPPDSNLQHNPSSGTDEYHLITRLPALERDTALFDVGDAKDVDEVADFEVGQIVETTKGNIRRGQWRYGKYDANIEPVGKVLEIRAISLCIDWICQNMMVSGRFVPVEPPEPWVSDSEEIWLQLKKFHRLSDGGEGDSTTDLERYDRVRFRNFDASMHKYNSRNEPSFGNIEKVPRSSTFGYDVNEFMIVAKNSWAIVQWQDLSMTRERTIDLFRCDSNDDHELWPGDFVVPTLEATESSRLLTIASDERPEVKETSLNHPIGDSSIVVTIPQRVGVVQSVEAASRIANIHWFSAPKVELAGEMIIPGSVTGQLDTGSFDRVSMYEVTAHPALSICRGDFVLIAPEPKFYDQTAPDSMVALDLDSRGVANPSTDNSDNSQESSSQAGTLFQVAEDETPRSIVDTGLIANLSASLINTSNPQLHTLSRLLHQFPTSLRPPFGQRPSTSEDLAASILPIWFGEVIDKGLDGLVTVRLGALDPVQNLRVPVERLTVVFDGEDFDDEDDHSDVLETHSTDGSISDADSYFSTEADDWISEQIFYEGGEPMEMGTEADWLTDDEDEHEMGGDSDQGVALSGESNTDDQLGTRNGNALDASKYINGGCKIDACGEASGVDKSTATENMRPVAFRILDEKAPSDHAFINRGSMDASANFLRRLNKEHKILQASLPEGIFVRTWESRLDLLRVLILGPRNTPYELAPFVFDFHLGAGFPSLPPSGFFHSWTNGVGRVNPNLYEDGKICLSLLGTWHGEKRSENWSSSGSSLLQVLVSLMGLVLVKEPYYNEAGFNIYVGAEEAAVNAALYSERAYILSRGFVKHVFESPVLGLEDIIMWLYHPKFEGGLQLLAEVLEKGNEVVGIFDAESTSAHLASSTHSNPSPRNGVPTLTAGAIVLLRKTLQSLERILAGLEDPPADPSQPAVFPHISG